MRKDEQPISVQELIRRYNRELMEFQKQHAAAQTKQQTESTAVPVENRLDIDFPVPDIDRDLNDLRKTQADAVPEEEEAVPVMAESQAETDRQRELEPGEMTAPEEIEPKQSAAAESETGQQRELTPGAMEPPPGIELPRGTLFMNATQRQQTGTDTANSDNPIVVPPAGADPAQPSQGIPAFPISPAGEEIKPTATQRDMSLGYLRASVTTGRGAIPVQNAQVVITREVDGEEALEQIRRTDNSGLTPLFTLPAVNSSYSQNPDNANPYTYYTIYVRAKGFYPVHLRNVPMYGGITALVPVDLIPVAEGGDPRREETITEGAPENLQ